MIFIIDCKKYNTATSEKLLVENYHKDCYPMCETVYRTQKGNYFKVVTNLITKRETAQLVDEQEFKNYIFKKYNSSYKEIFGEMEES